MQGAFQLRKPLRRGLQGAYLKFDPLIRRILKGARFKTFRQLEAEHQSRERAAEDEARKLEYAITQRQKAILFGIKPRIVKDGRSWYCMGSSVTGWGPTPARAYESWERYVKGLRNVYRPDQNYFKSPLQP